MPRRTTRRHIEIRKVHDSVGGFDDSSGSVRSPVGAQKASSGCGVLFSDVFGVDPEEIEGFGAFNVSLVFTLLLFIDPFLLFQSPKTEYQALHDQVIRYLRFLQDKSVAGHVTYGLLWPGFTSGRCRKLGSASRSRAIEGADLEWISPGHSAPTSEGYSARIRRAATLHGYASEPFRIRVTDGNEPDDSTHIIPVPDHPNVRARGNPYHG